LDNKLIIALPKGRILEDVLPLLEAAGIKPEKAFFNDDERRLSFSTNNPNLDLIRVRSIDMGTIISFGAAHFGIAGSDVLTEIDSPEIYTPVDLGVGQCRMVVAEPASLAKENNPQLLSHIRVATKYPEITRRHFAAQGIHAECIKLNGAIEVAPSLGLCRRIVDLVSTGSTLKANGLVEVEKIMDVSSKLAINRSAMKTRPQELSDWINNFREVVKSA
tara:strand:+ start:66 stop:722 length:657 start_codon:yes stop_codon:yes gene_type:complete